MKIHFNQLPAETRARMVAAFTGTGGRPAPIFSLLSFSRAKMVGMAIAAVAGPLLTWPLFQHQYGRPGGEQGGPELFLYCLLLGLAMAGLVAFIKGWWARRQFPFPPGRYMLALDYIDARRARLDVRSLLGMSAPVRIVHQHVNMIYTGTDMTFHSRDGAFSVRLAGKDRSEKLLADLRSAQHWYFEAAQREDFTTMGHLDPLGQIRDVNFSLAPEKVKSLGPGAADAPRAEPYPLWLCSAWLTGAVIGIALGFSLWTLRGPGHERGLLRYLQAQGTVPQLLKYVHEGWRYRGELDERLVQELRARGTVAQIQDYIKAAMPHSREVREGLLPERAFTEARNKHSVLALRNFCATYAQSALTVSASQGILEMFAKAREQYREDGSGEAGRRAAVMAWMDWLEREGAPPVKVAIHGVALEMDKMDGKEITGDNGEKLQLVNMPSTVFGENRPVREARIIGAVQAALGSLFPNDCLLPLEQDGRQPAKSLQGAPGPWLEIAYIVRPSGDVFTFGPKGGPVKDLPGYICLAIDLTVRLWGGGQAGPLTVPLNLITPASITINEASVHLGALTDIRRYECIFDRTLDELLPQWRLFFLREGSPPYLEARKTIAELRGLPTTDLSLPGGLRH